jgi:hypothetical protein
MEMKTTERKEKTTLTVQSKTTTFLMTCGIDPQNQFAVSVGKSQEKRTMTFGCQFQRACQAKSAVKTREILLT